MIQQLLFLLVMLFSIHTLNRRALFHKAHGREGKKREEKLRLLRKSKQSNSQ